MVKKCTKNTYASFGLVVGDATTILKHLSIEERKKYKKGKKSAERVSASCFWDVSSSV